MGVSVILNTPLKEQRSFIKKGSQQELTSACKGSLSAIKIDIDNIDVAIDELIKSDVKLKRLFELLLQFQMWVVSPQYK